MTAATARVPSAATETSVAPQPKFRSTSVGALLVVIASYAVVYARALTLGYIEGDDAASLAYHLFGRNRAVQLPYSPWQGLMDRWLSIFPANEAVLRTVAMLTTSLAACIATSLLVVLALRSARIEEPMPRTVAALAVLIAVPELFYLGLVYEPSMVALSLVLTAHLLAVRGSEVTGRAKLFLFAAAALVFGTGVGVRWDLGVYGVVIVAELSLDRRSRKVFVDRAGLAAGVLWGVAAGVGVVLAIALSGYTLADVLQTLRVARSEIDTGRATGAHIVEVIGAAQTLFTPVLVIMVVAGAFKAFKDNRRLLVILAVAIIPIAPYLYSREPKMLLPMFAPLLALFVLGVDTLWWNTHKWQKAAIVIIAVAPWTMGLQVISSGTSYGPGFVRNEVIEATAPPKLALSLKGGFAVPTPEGPRPLGGHASVLLGGEWRRFISDMQSEQREAIARAVREHLPIVQLDRDSMLLPYIAAAGFETHDAERRVQHADNVTARTFVNGAESFTAFTIDPAKSLFADETLARIEGANSGNAVFYFGNYANVLRQVKRYAPSASLTLGPYSTVTNIQQLRASLSAKGHQ